MENPHRHASDGDRERAAPSGQAERHGLPSRPVVGEETRRVGRTGLALGTSSVTLAGVRRSRGTVPAVLSEADDDVSVPSVPVKLTAGVGPTR